MIPIELACAEIAAHCREKRLPNDSQEQMTADMGKRIAFQENQLNPSPEDECKPVQRAQLTALPPASTHDH